MQDQEIKIKVFDYYPQFDAFLCTKKFQYVNGMLGLSEWTPVVWVGRLFARDQDFGEHTFDNWDEREELEEKFKEQHLDIDFQDMLIVCPERFTEGNQSCWKCKKSYKTIPCPECGGDLYVGADGPCYSDEIKKLFWTDVFKSLEISYATMIAVAREQSVITEKELEAFIIEVRNYLLGGE